MFDDPAFAVVPVRDDIEFLLGLAGRRADVIRGEAVHDLVRAARAEWADHALSI